MFLLPHIFSGVNYQGHYCIVNAAFKDLKLIEGESSGLVLSSDVGPEESQWKIKSSVLYNAASNNSAGATDGVITVNGEEHECKI